MQQLVVSYAAPQTVDSEAHVVHISRDTTVYTLESISSLKQITYHLEVTINFKKKKTIKREPTH